MKIDSASNVNGKWSLTSICFETVSCYCFKDGNACDIDHRCMNGNCDRCYWCTDVSCITVAIPGGGGTGSPSWPTDPPLIYTGGTGGGGGGGNPPDDGDCTGIGDCRPSSLVVEGRVPCGGCGPGPMVVVPIDSGELPTHNQDSIPNLISSICSQYGFVVDSFCKLYPFRGIVIQLNGDYICYGFS